MKKIYFLAINFLLLMAGCGNNTESDYTGGGIAFTIPAGWFIDGEEDMGAEGYYVAVEKKGANSSGLVVFMIYDTDEELDLSDYLEIYLESLEEEFSYISDGDRFETSPIIDYSYGIHTGISTTYNVPVENIPHSGRLYAFRSGEKVVTVLEQEALEDSAKNLPGFQRIRETLQVR